MKIAAFATLVLVLGFVSVGTPVLAQNTGLEVPKADKPVVDTTTAKIMDLTQPGENHKYLEELVGSWSYQVKFWMVPGAPANESTGESVCKSVFGGRYFLTDASGKMEMPDSSGQMKQIEFKGMSTDGYDNVKQKFVSAWIDNMGTGIVTSEGTYDPATKTITYHTEEEMMPGVKTQVRETLKFIDHNHHLLEWYENHDGQEAKIMEISYTRKG